MPIPQRAPIIIINLTSFDEYFSASPVISKTAAMSLPAHSNRRPATALDVSSSDNQGSENSRAARASDVSRGIEFLRLNNGWFLAGLARLRAVFGVAVGLFVRARARVACVVDFDGDFRIVVSGVRVGCVRGRRVRESGYD